MNATAEKTCPECGLLFSHQVRYESKRAYCSKSCRLRAWRRLRRALKPEVVRAEEKAAYWRNREKKLPQMRARHARKREVDNARNRANRAAKADEYRAYDRARWTGERREKMNEKRGKAFQSERILKPWKHLLKTAEERARRKGVSFSLDFEWVEAHWSGRCELTGLEFFLGQRGSGPKMLSPSIDRVRPELGYIPSNCRFVLWAVNAFKGEGDDELMFRIAESLLSFRKSPLNSKA